MVTIKPLDPKVSIMDQKQTNLSPVTLVNILDVAEEDIPALIKA